MRIAIIGGGGWGLALSKLLCENSHAVLVWEHDPANLKTLLATHSNPLLLKGIELPKEVSFCGDFAAVADFSPQLIILATPTQFLRSTLQNIPPVTRSRIWTNPDLLAVVNVAKGIEENSLLTISQILSQELPSALHPLICSLSGPSHAEEVARRIPTAVVIAGSDEVLLKRLQEVFSNAYFRVYRSNDLLGVEIGGAVKNIIAIAAGIITGLSYGDNTIGALLTRGLVEIQRFGVKLGARPETFLGLSGIGDLITTATSPHSRNRHVGEQIGRGQKLPQIIATMNTVAEGVATTRSVFQLSQKIRVEMPIVEQIHQVLYHDREPRQAITELMTRELKAEGLAT